MCEHWVVGLLLDYLAANNDDGMNVGIGACKLCRHEQMPLDRESILYCRHCTLPGPLEGPQWLVVHRHRQYEWAQVQVGLRSELSRAHL